MNLIIFGPLVLAGIVSKKRWRMNAADSSVCTHCGFDSGVPAGIAPVCQQCGRNRLVSDPRRALRT